MPHISLGRRRGWVEPSESRDVFSQAAQHNARFRTPKHGGRYLMDGGVADTACHTQAVVLLKLFNTTRKLSGPLRTQNRRAERRRRKHTRSNAQEPWLATHRTTTLSMVRKVQRNSHPKPIIYPHLWC